MRMKSCYFFVSVRIFNLFCENENPIFSIKEGISHVISCGIYFVQNLKVKPILRVIRLELYFKNTL